MSLTAPAGLETWGDSVLTIILKVQQHGGWHSSLPLERSSVFTCFSRPILYKSSQIPPVHCKHRSSGGWGGGGRGEGTSLIYILHFWKLMPVNCGHSEKYCFWCFYKFNRNNVLKSFEQILSENDGLILKTYYWRRYICRTRDSTSVVLTIISSRLPSSSWICQWLYCPRPRSSITIVS